MVLNSLAGEFVDASLSLLAPGGRFLEMGKTDVRDASAMATRYPGTRYRAFDLAEAGLRIGEILARIAEGFAKGELRPLPVTTFAVTEAEGAFRYMAQARHTGKIVVEMRVRDPHRYRGEGVIRFHLSDDVHRYPIRIESSVPVLGATILTLESVTTPPHQLAGQPK